MPGVSEAAARRRGAAVVARRRDARRDDRSSSWPRRSTASAGATSPAMKAVFVPFTAQTRMSGVDLDGREIRKGRHRLDRDATSPASGGTVAPELRAIVDRISRSGGTPLVVAERTRALGVIHLKDVVKGGIRERFAALRAMGIRTVMITGDNPLTAASIASEAGVDDFLAAGDAGRQDGADQARAAGRQAGRDDRRRHQRRAGAGSGGRRRGDEHRHAGRQGSRQHGRSRLEPDQADRHRRDRQAAADDARRADHVLDRQRRREVLRDHPRDVHRRRSRRWSRSTSWA